MSNNFFSPRNIILDLDETLVYSFDSNDEYYSNGISRITKEAIVVNFRKRIYNFKINIENSIDIVGITRPYLDIFIDFCFKNFDNVIIWSAGEKKYVNNICNWIFKGHKYPNQIFTRNDCKVIDGENRKPLDSIFIQDIIKDPELKYTLFVDDKSSVLSENMNNAIIIPNYKPIFDENILNHDDYLLRFIKWYSENNIRNVEDIKLVKKDNIFD